MAVDQFTIKMFFCFLSDLTYIVHLVYVCMHPGWKSPFTHPSIPSDLLCQTADGSSDPLPKLCDFPWCVIKTEELQHSSQSEVAATLVEMTALPPWASLSPISALNNGFRFLFILLICLPPSLISHLPWLTLTWPALIIIIVAGYHKKAATEITQALTGCYLREWNA